MFCNVVHILLSEHLREGYDLNIIWYRILVQQFFTISYHRLVCYGCGLGYSLVKEVLCCSYCIYMYLIFIKVWQFMHVWMVLREFTVYSCVDGTESWQCTHVWMVLRELTVYSRVDGT